MQTLPWKIIKYDNEHVLTESWMIVCAQDVVTTLHQNIRGYPCITKKEDLERNVRGLFFLNIKLMVEFVQLLFNEILINSGPNLIIS